MDRDRAFAHPEVLRKTLFSTVYREPFFKCRLKVEGIERLSPGVEAVGFYGLLHEIDRVPNGIEISWDDPPPLSVLGSDLSVTLEVSDEVDHYREHRFTLGGRIESFGEAE